MGFWGKTEESEQEKKTILYNCEHCLFWRACQVHPDCGQGSCAFLPPVIVPVERNHDVPRDYITVWPITDKNQWCGQFVDKEEIMEHNNG